MASQTSAFDFDGLPRVSAVAPARSRAIARALAGLDGLYPISARGLGRMTFSVEAIDPAPWRPGPAAHPSPESAFMLVRPDGAAACLTIERFFALALVRAALNAPTPPVLRPLSPSERGVLAALVASVLSTTGRGSLRVSLDRPLPVEDNERVLLTVGIQAAGISGSATLDLPIAWFPSGVAVVSPAAATRLETALAVTLARTDLDGGAYQAAELGDALVFEGVSALRDDQPWPCELWIGSNRALAELLATGDLRLRGRFEPGGPSFLAEHMSDNDTPKAGLAPAISAEGAALLASSPVEVVAEIGRLSLRGDEVVGLVSGAVLSLGERRRDLVTLRVGGRIWARGELVNVDDELGVRITEIVRPR